MPDFYVLNKAPVIVAATAKEAARLYAVSEGIDAGSVLIAERFKTFDTRGIPADVQVTER